MTNLISHDRGRPLHVFDADKLKGNMQARFAKDGEEIAALDGKTYTLDSAMMRDRRRCMPRAASRGVMGGEDTGCTETTTNVFVESALFDPARIAATGRKLGIISDARYRFERGVDPEFVLPGLELATKLILEFCGGEPSEIVVAGASPDMARKTIAFSPIAVKRLGGPRLCRAREIVRHPDQSRFRDRRWRADAGHAALLAQRCIGLGRSGGRSGAHSRPRQSAVRADDAARMRWRMRCSRLRNAARARCAARLPRAASTKRFRFSFIPRAHAELFGGGDDARQIENPIACRSGCAAPQPIAIAARRRRAQSGARVCRSDAVRDRRAIRKRRARRAETMAAGIRVGAARATG